MKSKKFYHNNLLPLTADARTEHLLLAARKIGRERANMVSGFMRRIEKEKEELLRERDAERLDRDKVTAGVGGNAYYRKDVLDLGMSPSSATSSTVPPMPKTPKRGTVGGQPMTHFLTPTLMTPRSDFYPPANHTPNSFVFVGSPPITSYQNSISTPRPAGHPSTTTPATKATQASVTSATHPTPLASLLSAAKSMMDDESNEPGTNSNGRRRAGALEPPDSPLPKRRKVGNGGASNNAGKVDMLAATATPGTDRVRSALDVLADQAAAAFDSDWQSPTKPPTKMTSKNRGKDKGSAATRSRRAGISSEIDDDSTPKGKTRSTEDLVSRISTGSPVSTRSRSKVLLTDRLSKEPSKTPQRKKNVSSDSQPRSVPAPRMIFSPRIRSSIPPLPSLSPAPPPTTPDAVSVDNSNASDITSAPMEGPRAENSMEDDNITPANGISESPTPSNAGDDCPRISEGSPSNDVADAYIHIPPQRAATVNKLTDQDEIPVPSNTVTAFTTKTHGNELNSAADENYDVHGERDVEPGLDGEKEREDASEERGIQPHVTRSSPDDGPDTDADAEGEMDVDAEETVFVDSSLAQELLSLAPSSPQLEKADVNSQARVRNDERDSSASHGISPMNS